jgi:hypothetical protein
MARKPGSPTVFDDHEKRNSLNLSRLDPFEDDADQIYRSSRGRGGDPQWGLMFLTAAKNGNAAKLEELLGQDPPVNIRDPIDHAAALHYIAAFDARPALRVVMKSDALDYLVRDREGRLPSELAREVGNDDAMARLLMIKEMRQAQARGIDPRSLYKVSARRPTKTSARIDP